MAARSAKLEAPPGAVWLGCSGWSYPTWRPAFYPAKTPTSKLLTAYAERLNTVEVNYTFRRALTPSVAAGWLRQAPAPFRFSIKAPQTITHVKRLRDAGEAVRAFASSLAPLADAGRLGPVLFQLPPTLHGDTALLSGFLAELEGLGLRTAWEFRHVSWFQQETYDALHHAGAALCAAESDDLASPDLALAPGLRVYRLRRSAYSADALTALAALFTETAKKGAEVYAFFKHEDAPDGPIRAAEVLRQIPEPLRG